LSLMRAKSVPNCQLIFCNYSAPLFMS
jgi:hypothetical protein